MEFLFIYLINTIEFEFMTFILNDHTLSSSLDINCFLCMHDFNLSFINFERKHNTKNNPCHNIWVTLETISPSLFHSLFNNYFYFVF